MLVLALAASLAVIASGCARSSLAGAGDHPPSDSSGGGDAIGSAPPSGFPTELDEVTVQFDGPDSSLYGGFYAADDQDFYSALNLDVTLDPADPGEDAVAAAAAPDGPEFLVSWAAPVLKARETGADLVNIAQLIDRSGTRLVALKASGIAAAKALAGKKVAALDAGRDVDVRSTLAEAGLDPTKGARITAAPFDPTALLSGRADVAEVETFDEWAQVLETPDPATGLAHVPADFTTIDAQALGTGTLQEGIYARAAWLAQPGNADIATRLLRAVFRGYAFCRDGLDDCAQLALDNGSTRTLDHETWVMNEVNALIWPAPNGVGLLDPAAWTATIKLATDAGVITTAPAATASRSDLAAAAAAGVTDDLKGAGYARTPVDIVPLTAQPTDEVPTDEPDVTLPPQ